MPEGFGGYWILVHIPQIVLASQSPRRRELLDAGGIPSTVRVSNIDETVHAGEDAIEYVRRMALGKARAVDAGPDEIILAADTTVVRGGQILGKPCDPDDARRMLRVLSGGSHTVITGICLRHGDKEIMAHEETQVWFTALTPAEIDDYVNTGEPMDKAGAYAIQGIASRYIERIVGSYSNVVGLPVSLVWRELNRLRTSASPVTSVLPEV